MDDNKKQEEEVVDVQISDSFIYGDNYPFRNIKTSEFKGGLCWDFEKKRVWWRNTNPEIDKEAKYWNFIKVLRSTTQVVHWLIKMHHRYFVILQSQLYQLDEVCSIFEADSKGRYDSMNPIAIYQGYVDIESAADRFAQEYMAMLINLRDPEVKFLFPNEIPSQEMQNQSQTE